MKTNNMYNIKSKLKKAKAVDTKLNLKWNMVSRHMQTRKKTYIANGYLCVICDDAILRLVKQPGKNIMRVNSRLDWAWYDPKDLAHAIDNGTVEAYYGQQLIDFRSYPNDWKDLVEEIDTKTHYAHRVGRQLDQLDNI